MVVVVVVVDTYRSHDQYDYYYNDYYYYYNGLVGCVLSWVGRGRLGRPHTPPIHRRPKMTLFLGGEKDKSVRGGKPLPKWNNWVPTYLPLYHEHETVGFQRDDRQYLARSLARAVCYRWIQTVRRRGTIGWIRSTTARPSVKE